MQLETEQVGGVTVLRVRGKLTVDHGADALSRTVRDLADQGRTAVVLDLQGVDVVDSLGIEALVASHVSVKRRGGRLALASPSPRLCHLLEITRLSQVLETHPDRKEALAGFLSG